MDDKRLDINGVSVRVHRYNTVVVGSGAAGLNAAEYLHRHGQPDVAVVTEGLGMGTSRNTGSDKQTYYKLTLCGGEPDSVRKTAQTLFEGGCMDGDLALAEAACSAQCFYRLVELGVPFPHNSFGEFVGYKTDHDPVKRGTSAGPLTSKYMTECLLKAVRERGVPIHDRRLVIEILVSGEESGRRCHGVLTLDLDNLDAPDSRYVLFLADNVVYATGGEAGMYSRSVFPPSQTGGTGNAFRAGVKGKNLTEWQFGIASTQFRWNLSGSYQQVLPRYVSTNQDGGDPREFLDEFFPDTSTMLTAIFLKGYQWPFDPRKTVDHGSSLIDLLVYNETMQRGRRVFLDYTRNPSRAETGGALDFSLLAPEVHEYLANSGALLPTPIRRLDAMNPAAIDLYRSHDIDIATGLLEIDVSAQHNNGGLSGNGWWESDIAHFFPVGEVNGSHGIFRPGGSALNSGQVGGMRAAQFILHRYREAAPEAELAADRCGRQLDEAVAFGENALCSSQESVDIAAERKRLGDAMSRHAAHIRSRDGIIAAQKVADAILERLNGQASVSNPGQLPALHRLRDVAVSASVYLAAMLDYIDRGGGSRGSYLVQDAAGQLPAAGLPESFRHRLDSGEGTERIQEAWYRDGRCHIDWRARRPMPEPDDWFETVWRQFREEGMYQV